MSLYSYHLRRAFVKDGSFFVLGREACRSLILGLVELPCSECVNNLWKICLKVVDNIYSYPQATFACL
jgi:hypothetical protein